MRYRLERPAGIPPSSGNYSIALWSTGKKTIGKDGATLVMQSDGNLVYYDSRAVPLWYTATDGTPNSYFRLQNDGNMVVYDPNGNPLWSSRTNGH